MQENQEVKNRIADCARHKGFKYSLVELAAWMLRKAGTSLLTMPRPAKQ